jgi:hypothetical protein
MHGRGLRGVLSHVKHGEDNIVARVASTQDGSLQTLQSRVPYVSAVKVRLAPDVSVTASHEEVSRRTERYKSAVRGRITESSRRTRRLSATRSTVRLAWYEVSFSGAPASPAVSNCVGVCFSGLAMVKHQTPGGRWIRVKVYERHGGCGVRSS